MKGVISLKKDCKITIGYSYDSWIELGEKVPIEVCMDTSENTHVLLTGMSGSGKSYGILQLTCRIARNFPEGRILFSDYKGDDMFGFLKGCKGYYYFDKTIDALEETYSVFRDRMSGTDKSREQVTLIWDEFVANMLSLQTKDSKYAKKVMNMISEILMAGRSMATRLICVCQRPEASCFPSGGRINFGYVVILGAPIKSILEMLLPGKEYIDAIGDRHFKQGEGILISQQTDQYFIKMPRITDMETLQKICREGLNR